MACFLIGNKNTKASGRADPIAAGRFEYFVNVEFC